MKKKPVGRPDEGRVKMTVHVLPLTAKRINYLLDKKDREANTQGKVIDRQFGVQATKKRAGARGKSAGSARAGKQKHSGAQGHNVGFSDAGRKDTQQ